MVTLTPAPLSFNRWGALRVASGNMVAGFDQVAQAVGSLMFGGDAVAGGMLCGFAVIVVTYLVFLILFREHHGGINAVMPLAMGIVFVAVAGWFRIWTILFVVIILAFVLLNPLGDSG